MRIVFMAPEEPAYLPVFFERVVTALGDKVAAIVVVSPIYKGSTWLSQGIRFTKSFPSQRHPRNRRACEELSYKRPRIPIAAAHTSTCMRIAPPHSR